MAIDPETIGIFIGTVITSVGATWGGSKALKKMKPDDGQVQAQFCSEHKSCFEEIKSELRDQRRDIGEVKEGVAYIRGVIERGSV